MNNQEAYNQWSWSYDKGDNSTRDVEAHALKSVLQNYTFEHILEVGCGTGKNTSFLLTKTTRLTGIDFSEKMLEKAKEKIVSNKVSFVWADIRQAWQFEARQFDLVSFSLVLEHIQDLAHIFAEASRVLKSGGYLYIGELHPFKQYEGSKAKFEINGGIFELECFVHQISDFFQLAYQHEFEHIALQEWFEEKNKLVPRILSLLFRKK